MPVITNIEDLRDVRATDLRGGLRLEDEPSARALVLREAVEDDLHRHLHVEREMVRDPDAAHAAATEKPFEANALRDQRARGELHPADRIVEPRER